jgi:hypothetical protein
MLRACTIIETMFNFPVSIYMLFNHSGCTHDDNRLI